MNDPIRILPCSCKHEYQDGKYGKLQRVHNGTETDGKYRCSVCGNEKGGK